MSLLGNLITQVATQAMSPDDSQRHPINRPVNPRRTTGMGDILGSVLGGASNNRNASSGGFDMGGMLGNVISSQMGGGTSAGGMGGLGSILGNVLGSQMGGGARGVQRSGGGGRAMLIAALLPMVLGWIQRNGGLSGALGKIKDMGFGNQAQSWMSTDQENDNLDPNEVTKLFDTQQIQQVAAQTGADETEVRQGLAELLPEVMNQLTPDGSLAKEGEANQEIADIMQQISGVLKG